MSGGGGRTRPRYVGRWRPNAAAPCRAVVAERGRAMSGGGGRTRPRYVGRWRPNAAALCRAVAAERGRVMSGGGGRTMSGSGGRTRPHHVGWWRRPNAAALCWAVAAERGRVMSGAAVAAAPCRVALMGHCILGHHYLIPCFLSYKEVLVHAGGRLFLLFIILIKWVYNIAIIAPFTYVPRDFFNRPNAIVLYLLTLV